MDHATPNLPSRDFGRTAAFYNSIGFEVAWRDEGWMILKRGGLRLEFFRYPDLDPLTSSFGCCLRLDDAHGFFLAALSAGLEEKRQGQPRVHRPVREAWGGIVGALIDIDGTLLRLVQNDPA